MARERAELGYHIWHTLVLGHPLCGSGQQNSPSQTLLSIDRTSRSQRRSDEKAQPRCLQCLSSRLFHESRKSYNEDAYTNRRRSDPTDKITVPLPGLLLCRCREIAFGRTAIHADILASLETAVLSRAYAKQLLPG